MFVFKLTVPSDNLIKKFIYMSSINFKVPSLNISNPYKYTINSNIENISHDDPLHSQR